MSFTYHSAAITDIGLTRHENEDRFLCDDELGLFGVADGIGGLPGGAEAAECVVKHITQAIGETVGKPDLIAISQAGSAAVRTLGQLINPPTGIGSTLTFGRLKAGILQLAHIGDSRGYLLQDGDFIRLTIDHTIENEIHALKARGEKLELTPENRTAITRCMGQPGVPEVDYKEITVQKGDRYFFSTDGITRMIEDDELAAMLSGPGTPQQMLQTLLNLALERGGHDNLTAVLVFIDQV